MNKCVRVRYAPSPTGFLHIGGARTALINYLFAKHHGGTFVVRIEDTDMARNVEGGEASQLENLRWLGIIPDETVDSGGPYMPYRQSERLHMYTQYANMLLADKKAYKCFCTSAELEKVRLRQQELGIAPHYIGTCRHLTDADIAAKEAEQMPYTIRFVVPQQTEYVFQDLVRGEMRFTSEHIGDWIIVKANGVATYNFAVAIDDYAMNISHIFRGEEHLSNTPKQLMIFEAFGWEAPRYGHLTLIVNEQRKKLSKRDETLVQFIAQYKALGYMPEALVNYLALLGWTPFEERELFTMEELIAVFDAERLSKAPSMFDNQKLNWMNQQYVKQLTQAQIAEFLAPYIQEALPEGVDKNAAWLDMCASLYHTQLQYGQQISAEIAALYEPLHYDDDARSLLEVVDVQHIVRTFYEHIVRIPEQEWSVKTIKAVMKDMETALNRRGKALFLPIRLALTAKSSGPELPVFVTLLGKEEVSHRLRACLNIVNIHA